MKSIINKAPIKTKINHDIFSIYRFWSKMIILRNKQKIVLFGEGMKKTKKT